MTANHVSPLLIGVIVASVFMLKFALGGRRGVPAPILTSKPFLTAREQAMLITLEQLLPNYRIHAQVSMGALLNVKARPGSKANPADRNSFSQKIVDFVVQDRSNGQIAALIEVDDATHRAAADTRRDAMVAQAGYRTIRIPVKARPSVSDVQRSLGWLAESSILEEAAARL